MYVNTVCEKLRATLTSLRWAEVFSGSRGSGSGTASLLNAKRSTLYLFILETLLGSICLVRCDHLHEAKASGLLGVGVFHDLALLYFAILLEETSDLGLSKTWMNSSDEEVRSRVHRSILIFVIVILGSPVDVDG